MVSCLRLCMLHSGSIQRKTSTLFIRTPGTILEIRSKARSSDQPASCSSEKGYCLDEDDDDDDEFEEGEADDAFTWEPSERNAILTSNVRKYVVPKINFDATSYTYLID